MPGVVARALVAPVPSAKVRAGTFALGDSFLLGSARTMTAAHVKVDAKVGRLPARPPREPRADQPPREPRPPMQEGEEGERRSRRRRGGRDRGPREAREGAPGEQPWLIAYAPLAWCFRAALLVVLALWMVVEALVIPS